MHVLRHRAVGVGLDYEVDGTLLVYVANRCVWSDNWFLHLRALVLGNDGGCEKSVCAMTGTSRLSTYRRQASRSPYPPQAA
jgi:hypothetical protein